MTTPPIDTHTYRSPNYNSRPSGMAISSIVIHTTEGSFDSDAEWLCSSTSGVSTHYVLAPNGTIYALVDDAKRAWHAGESSYAGKSNYNDFSLGVEISHRQGQAYGPDQLPALTSLCAYLIGKYQVTRQYLVTHRQIAPDRKIDPTDWPQDAFDAWADTFYTPANPLRARTLPGAPPASVPIYCSAGAASFYTARGGLALCGYPLRDEFHDSSLNCDVLVCERVVIKESTQYGIEQALLSEARREGWLA